jgi:hypothetical protein
MLMAFDESTAAFFAMTSRRLMRFSPPASLPENLGSLEVVEKCDF